MKENKKGKVKKERPGRIWPVLLCLLLAGGVFIVLLNVETRQLSQYEKGSVVVAIMDVTEAKEITKENVEEYLSQIFSDAEYEMFENKMKMKKAPGYQERLKRAL